MDNNFDVLILGAGLSGIGAAVHLSKHCPSKKIALLENREEMGGTWDLFRYPGIRSDSDMYTLGYNFKPWSSDKLLADGPAIKKYIKETALEYGIDKKIQFGKKVTAVSWSSKKNQWTVGVLDNSTGKETQYNSNFIMSCTGYYNYEQGYQPDFSGVKKFKGQFIHPQHWPENLDYTGKKVVVIGSGATAVTIVPAMSGKAEHVTMLQRSPTYVVSIPGEDKFFSAMRKYVPKNLVYRVARTRNVAITYAMYYSSRRFPGAAKGLIQKAIKSQLGSDYDMKHFDPNYKPWDERMCMVPNGDLFKAIRDGKASIVTDHIESITAKGIKLNSGESIDADIIVSATGLNMQFMGGIEIEVDGEPVQAAERMNYKGAMLEGVPNAAIVFGYTNASWTLKADLVSEFVCRVINHMDKVGTTKCVPENVSGVEQEDLFDMTSGYLQRAKHFLPKQGEKAPWKMYQNYALDMVKLRLGKVDDGVLQFPKAS